ncbi:MAG: riboflavin biosynthesis protein RibF [Candidatus Zixiibacteriota bacterium]|nr:MAG: riboflavin biosynthesis protein RibF [candidate division Zixibacteria bacterium]
MIFIDRLGDYPEVRPGSAVTTIGTFDGIHRGHQMIFRRVHDIAQQSGLDPVLITFHPHPRALTTPDNVPMLLTSIQEKKKFIPDFFDGTVLILEFTRALMNVTAQQFVKEVLLDRIGSKKLVVGYDHGLGKDRGATAGELRQMGREHAFDVEIVEPVIHKNEVVSSSKIREAMKADSYEQAIELLGHDYAICGTVERGIGLGRNIGYPTANIRYSHRKLLPPQGVYACWAQINGKEKKGMAFIGHNHFNPKEGLSVEANLFDFDSDIYDKNIAIYPTTFIRANRKFDDSSALAEQIAIDKKQILEILSKEKHHAVRQKQNGRNNRQTSSS